jgi:hypothetical protein
VEAALLALISDTSSSSFEEGAFTLRALFGFERLDGSFASGFDGWCDAKDDTDGG